MRVLIVGLGSIARKHIECIDVLKSEIGMQIEVMVLRRKVRIDDVISGVKQSASLKEAMRWSPTHIIVCTPTSLHIDSLVDLHELGVPILLEKPASSPVHDDIIRLEKLDEVIDEVYVAYPYRFHSIIEDFKDIIARCRTGYWKVDRGFDLRKWQNYRGAYTETYAAKKSLGGGALSTLCHELDMFVSVLGYPDEILGHTTNTGLLGIEADDVAQYTLRWKDTHTATFHIDFLRPINCISVSVLSEKGQVTKLEFTNEKLRNLHSIEECNSLPDAGVDRLYAYSFLSLRDAYQAQINNFLMGDRKQLCTLREGIVSMKVMSQIGTGSY